MRSKLWVLSVICFLATAAWAAKVYLKDGTVISGKIENADREKVEITTSLGIKMSIPRESIRNIEYEPGEEQVEGLEESKKLVIAVVDFTNVGKDPQLEGLVKGIPESVTTYLGKEGKVRIVERSRLEAALKELQLGMTGIVDEKTAARVGKAVGASAIMVGSFLKIGDLIRINARLIDVQTGEVIMADQVQGRFEEVFGLMDQVAERIWEKLTGEGVDYFPHTIGSTWIYSIRDSLGREIGTQTVIVKGQALREDGKPVYVFNRSSHYSEDYDIELSEGEEYYLITERGVISTFLKADPDEPTNPYHEEILLKYPLLTGMRWVEGSGVDWSAVEAKESIEVPAGIFKNCWRLHYHVQQEMNLLKGTEVLEADIYR